MPYGLLAQLVERRIRIAEVGSSILPQSISYGRSNGNLNLRLIGLKFSDLAYSALL